jgi:hypothetical protein
MNRDRHIRRWGALPVPYTVSWSDEEVFHLDRCAYFQQLAVCQQVAPGVGKPAFGKPHCQRQREAMARGLCDLCGLPLRYATKVSLSHARVNPLGAQGPCVMQVEPMLHRECAVESIRHCPSLKRDVSNGTLFIRQVLRWRPQCALMDETYVESVTGVRKVALGHGKIELQSWIDRDAEWLGASEALAA